MNRSHRAVCLGGGSHVLVPATRMRNIALALLGAIALVLKSAYAGPFEAVVHSYGGNFAVTFALYFAAVSATHNLRRPRLIAALAALAVVTLFEITDGFGVLANVYDPLDMLANAIGVGFGLVVDLLTRRLMSRAVSDDSAVT